MVDIGEAGTATLALISEPLRAFSRNLRFRKSEGGRLVLYAWSTSAAPSPRPTFRTE